MNESIWEKRFNSIEELSQRLTALRSKYNYSSTDARRVAFTNCDVITTSTLIIIGMFAKYEKGILTPEELEKSWGISRNQFELASKRLEWFTKVSFITLFQFQMENLFRNILKGLNCSTKGGFWKITDRLLNELAISDRDSKHDILYTPALIRNSLHNGGIHYNFRGNSAYKNNKNSINNRKYEFIDGKKISCAHWEGVTDTLNASIDVVEEILSTNRVKNLTDPLKDEYFFQKSNE